MRMTIDIAQQLFELKPPVSILLSDWSRRFQFKCDWPVASCYAPACQNTITKICFINKIVRHQVKRCKVIGQLDMDTDTTVTETQKCTMEDSKEIVLEKGDKSKELPVVEIKIKGCGCTVEPLSSLEALLDFNPSSCPCPASPQESHTAPSLSASFSPHKLGLDGKPRDETGPKLIVCHDMKGGYLEDRFICGTENAVNYVFRHWAQTDYFIYFSHHFVSCPPVGWTTAGHVQGCKVLGTIITEWTEGEGICAGFLEDAGTMERVVTQLVRLAIHYAFDGYLLNIENPVKNTETLLAFIRLLHDGLRAASPDNVLFYYDSVIMDGTLSWQNELNENNKPFFDVCDGIFLNYCWDDEKLERSVSLAGERRTDVFVGLDVFGRNCYGGGGLNTDKALEKTAQYGLSAAIFAPGWSFECHPASNWLEMDNNLWGCSARFLTYRAIEISPREDSSKSKILLHTSFNLGYGQKRFHFGQEVGDGTEWFDLRETAYQPVLVPQDTEDEGLRCGGTYDTESGFLGGGSLRISPSKSPALWLPLSTPPDAPVHHMLLLLIWKGDEEPSVTYRNDNSRNFKADENENRPNQRFEFGLNELVAEAGAPAEIRFELGPDQTQTCTRSLNGWNLTACILDSEVAVAKGGFCIGAETSSVQLGYLSLTAL